MPYNTRAKQKEINGVVGVIVFVFIKLPFMILGFIFKLLLSPFKGRRKRKH